MADRRRVSIQHEDWLNLADPESPWYSLPVLKRAFPNGLDPTPSEIRAEHKARWYGDNGESSARLAADRTEYLGWLLRDVLRWGTDYIDGADLPAELADGVTRYEVNVAPAGAYLPAQSEPVGLFDSVAEGEDAGDPRPRVLVFHLSSGTDPLDRPATDSWPATWVQRAALACRHMHVPLAVVSDGDYLTLVHAPEGNATGWGTWRASEFATEPILLDSFRSMLHRRRFAGVSDTDTPEALLVESAATQAEVTDQLGSQVRRATELLVNAISRANQSRGEELLKNVGPHEVYEAAVTVMMRTVFLLIAEENGLLPVDNPHYQMLYAIRTLRESLESERRDNAEVLETRTTAWHRLLATSRAVHSGVHHDELSVPAYGGNLFDPDRFPFLEGRVAGTDWHRATGTPIPVTDLDVLAVLDALLVLRFRNSGGVTDTRRLSYRQVDVEQIGHIYERLLDHDALVADTVVLGLKGKAGEEPEVALPDLESKLIDGDTALVAWLSNKDASKVGRYVATKKQIQKLLAEPIPPPLRAGLQQACQGDVVLAARIEPFANLLRLDLRDRPLVFLRGSVYVTETGSRRDSGTAYTTRELAEEVAEHALAPLAYSPGPQDTPDTNQWRIRPSSEILELKVCDPAVGSGAILVAACRYLADRLIEAWRAEGDPHAAETATAADDPNRLDVIVQARRLVAEHCCYGVDRNPMAVEMAKLSMWLTTVAKDRPFTFLDHALKSGDSLLGIWDLDQLRYLHYDIAAGRGRATPIPGFETGGDAVVAVEVLVEEALDMRREMHGIETIRPSDVERKQKLHLASEKRLHVLATIADVVAGAAISTAGERDASAALSAKIEADAGLILSMVDVLETAAEADAMSAVRERARLRLDAGRPPSAPSRRPLHWPIAFPEVFDRSTRSTPGFDAMVGNPPFIGGQKITGAAGTDYRNHLIAWLAGGAKGSADLVAYFFLDATKVAHSLGYLATNTIAQGDTSEVGLAQLLANGWQVNRAVASMTWPGDASLEIAKIWASRGHWNGIRMLDSAPVRQIDRTLRSGRDDGWTYAPLLVNRGGARIGSDVNGDGFFVAAGEVAEFLGMPGGRDVVREIWGGDELNQHWPGSSPRSAFYFGATNLQSASEFPELLSSLRERVYEYRSKRVDRLAEYWWQFKRPTVDLYDEICRLPRVLAMARNSDVCLPVWMPPTAIYTTQAVIFLTCDDSMFGLISSEIHRIWAYATSSTLGKGLRYSPSDSYDSFVQPDASEALEAIAQVACALDNCRRQLCGDSSLSLLRVYSLLHDESLKSTMTMNLRDLHVELDYAVCDAYGWSDLDLGHGFHEVRDQGTRFTCSPESAGEVLVRLLELNKERYEFEVAAGLHQKGKQRSMKRAANQTSLLGDDT